MLAKTLIIGLGQFGMELAKSLARQGFFVLAVDRNPDLVQAVSKEVNRALELDATNENALLEIGAEQVETAICAIGEKYLEASIMTTALLKKIGIPQIIARATTPLHSRILKQVGALETINPEEEMGKRLAQKLARPGLIEMIPLSEDIVVSEIHCPTQFHNRSLKDLKLRTAYNITVISINRSTAGSQVKVMVNPEPDTILQQDDLLLVVGNASSVDKLSQLH